jgi:asparagine synthase (glutamine-hydrolysing)
MCGISGFIDFRKSSSAQDLQRMNETLAHRGPDGGSVKLIQNNFAQIGFAHRRLSIIDLTEGGTQPMTYKHLTMVFNGEIYNYKEIKEELSKIGHRFSSTSDSEMVLHAYEEWGIDCVHKFVGMFAIVIFDRTENTVVCIRDRAGVKPFNYFWNGSIFIFGSELKAIVAHNKFAKEICTNALALYLQYGYIPAPHCIYSNTYKLQPGHYLTVNLKEDKFSTTQYWNVYDYYNKPKLRLDFNTAKKETEKIIAKACAYRMVSDVPVGVFLSGGYDSSLVTALLQVNSTARINTFTIGFDDKQHNEAEHAKKVANHLGTNHTEFYCTQKQAADLIDKIPYYYDEPFADASAIPTMLVSQVAKQKVTVALSADAGDEVFAGYNRYEYIVKFGNKIKKIPKPIRSALAAGMNLITADSVPYFNQKYLFHSRYEKVKHFLRDAEDFNINQILNTQFSSAEIVELLKQTPQALATAFQSRELKSEYYSTLDYVMAIDYQTYMVDDILQKVDRATMSASLEGREPLLDQNVIEWAATLPTEYKYFNGQKKYILKEIVHQYIPKEIMERPKMGFGIPIEDWLNTEFKEKVAYYFSEAYVAKQNIFNLAAVKQVVESFYAGKKEKAEKIWYLLMFQMWYDKWMH